MWTKVRYVCQFLVSCAYLLLIAGTISFSSKAPLWICFGLVLLAALTVFTVGLMLAVRWANTSQGDERPQWSFGSLMFLIGLAALYFGLTRQLLTPAEVSLVGGWVAALIASGVMLLAALPFVLLLGEVLLVVAAWIVHRPWFRRWVLRLRRRAIAPDPKLERSDTGT
jgi:hypothetical protein